MIVYYIVAFKMMVVFFVVVKCHVERKIIKFDIVKGLKNRVDKLDK